MKTHTYKGGDKVIETYSSHRTEAEIVTIEASGAVTLRNKKGEEWRSNLVWLSPSK